MQMIIDGIHVDASDNSTIEIKCPATGQLLDTVPNATKEDVDRAVAAALKGQKIWAATPVHQRADILYRFLELVESNKDQLATTLCLETGKPLTEAKFEVGNIAVAFKAFIEKAKHIYGEIIPAGSELGKEKHLQLVVREPLGVIACIIPFNMPCNLFDQKVAPTLMAGNAALIKPSHQNPLTICMLVEMLAEAGVPAGAVQVITGRGQESGSYITHHPDIHAITFTGSTTVGIETAKAGAEHLAHVTLELGGNDAFIVCADADIDLAVEEVVLGRMFNTGQVCCSSKRFIVDNKIKAEFTQKVIARLQKINRGAIDKPETQLGCLINEEAAINVDKQVQLTVAQGGKIALGGQRDGAFYDPTVIVDVPKNADIATDMEVFGPVVPIIGFDSETEALDIANNSIYGLNGCIFTADLKKAYQMASLMECGSVIINGASFFRSFEMPFGGHKYSGIGSEGAMTTFDEVTQCKTIVLKNILA